MKKKELMTLLTALAFIFSMPSAFANQMSNQELTLAFGSQINPKQVTVLSQQEMENTQGELFIWGAVTGLGMYGGKTLYNSWE